MNETNQHTLCVLVGERRENGGIWPLVTIDLPEDGEIKMTGRKSAHLAVPVLRRALMAAELQAARWVPVAKTVAPAPPAEEAKSDVAQRVPTTTKDYSAGDGF